MQTFQIQIYKCSILPWGIVEAVLAFIDGCYKELLHSCWTCVHTDLTFVHFINDGAESSYLGKNTFDEPLLVLPPNLHQSTDFQM